MDNMRKYIYSYLILIFIGGCDRYFELIPESYYGNLNYKIMKNEIFLYFVDTVRINSNTPLYNLDSTLNVFVNLQVRNDDNKWEDKCSYFITDAKDLKIVPYRINDFKRGNPDDSLDYCYRVMFYTGNYIKYPIKFHMVDFNNQEHIITFVPQKIEEIDTD
jgi:hypothetical protein